MYRAADTPDNTISVNEPQEPKREVEAAIVSDAGRNEADRGRRNKNFTLKFIFLCRTM